MTVVPQGGDVSRGGGGGSGTLYDVLDLILDRGLVIDVFVRVSLVGIEILKIDARVVVASVDTYLRFAEACNRLDLESGRKAPAQLTDVVGDTLESGAKGKSKGALGGAMEAVADSLTGGGKRQADDDRAELEEGTDAEEREPVEERRPTRRARASRRERER
jgi:hypothetical protein